MLFFSMHFSKFLATCKVKLQRAETRGSFLVDLLLLICASIAVVIKVIRACISIGQFTAVDYLYWGITLGVLATVVLTVALPKLKFVRALLAFAIAVVFHYFDQDMRITTIGFYLAAFAFLFDAPLRDGWTIFVAGAFGLVFLALNVVLYPQGVADLLPLLGALGLCGLVYSKHHHLNPRKQRFDLSLVLSPREAAYVHERSLGKSYKEIAYDWQVAPSTVRNTVAKALPKLDLEDTTELHRMATTYELFIGSLPEKSPKSPQ